MVDARNKSRFGFPKEFHLRRPADFRRVYDRRCSVSDSRLIVYGLANDLAHCRVGFSVSRKIGKAVARNRLRRLYREAFRLTRSELPTGIDLVFLPRSAAEPTLEELKTSLQQLLPMLAKKLLRK